MAFRRRHPERAAPGARRARLGIAFIFFANGCGFGSWVPHIPEVRAALGLSDAALGLALLALAAGATVALPASGVLTARLGSRPVTRAAAVLFCAALPLPLLAPDFASLALALALLGMASGALDVAMNAQAVAIEERYRRPIMSSFHGLFSLGGLVGAVLAAGAIQLGLTPFAHLASAAALLGTGVAASLFALLPTAAASGGPILVLPRGRLVVLGLIALGGLMAEGAVADWSAVYLRDVLATDAAVAALGFAAFSLTMAAGRMTGDAVVARIGPAGVLGAGSALGALTLGAALVAGQPAAALVGFAGVGLGLANVVPVVFSAAGRMPGVAPGVGIAAVSTAGYCGFLAGPPLIGFLAELAGLAVGLGLVALALALMALGGGTLKPDEARSTAADPCEQPGAV